MTENRPTETWSAGKVVGVCIAAVSAIAVLGVLLAGLTGGGAGEPDAPEPNYTAAITECRDAVRPMLKDPDSAEFSDETYAENEDGVRWRIRGTVRAENSFGATTPTEYECIASWGGSAFTAEVTQLG